MTNAEKIEPALTRVEWADFIERLRIAKTQWIEAEARGELVHDLVDGRPNLIEFHATSAMALYGQPFGFTRADVTLLRDAAYNDSIEGAPEWVALNALADRIAALLPPE